MTTETALLAHSPIRVFEDVALHLIDRNGMPWVTARDVARALGYRDERSVLRIHHRADDEFDETMTTVVKLTTVTGPKPTRIFSPRGCHLVGMLAKTKRAKAFRRWVLDVLEHRAYDAPIQQAESYWFALRPHWRPIRRMAYAGWSYRRIARRLGRSPASVGHCVKRMIEVGLMDPARLLPMRYRHATAQRKLATRPLYRHWGRAGAAQLNLPLGVAA